MCPGMITGRSRRRLVAIMDCCAGRAAALPSNSGGWVERRLEKVEHLLQRSRALPVDDQTT